MRIKKIHVIALFGFALVIAGFLLVYGGLVPQLFISPIPTRQPVAPSSLPISPDGETASIPTAYGGVAVRNFYKNPIEVSGKEIVIHRTPEYVIAFYEGDHSFSVALLQKPLEVAREHAEAELLRILGVSRTDMCKLTVSLAIPVAVDNALSGRNYGLSFCYNGVPFQ